MTFPDITKSILRIAIAIFLISAVIMLNQRKHFLQDDSAPAKTRTDTLTVRDTIFIRQPVQKTVRKIDTIYVAKTSIDTIVRTDTVYLLLPKEQRHYENENYSAWISGYQPQLDSIRIHQEHQIITSTLIPRKPTSRRWGIGIQAGYGATIHNNQLITSPYIGIGISWNIVSF